VIRQYLTTRLRVSFLFMGNKFPAIILIAYSCIARAFDVNLYRTNERVCCCGCYLSLFQFIVMNLGVQGNVQLLDVVNTVMKLRGTQKCY
jgi:hypothetical protein